MLELRIGVSATLTFVGAALSSAYVPQSENINSFSANNSRNANHFVQIRTRNDSSFSNRSVRIQKRGEQYHIQTSITTFQKKESSGYHDRNTGAPPIVDLHSQIHFGDESYFNYFNQASFNSQYDYVLYEMIADERFFKESSSSPASLKQLIPSEGKNPIAPTPSDRATAFEYGLQCQLDVIQYCKEGWIHADFTREEFLNVLEPGQVQKQSTKKPDLQPLWALASTAATYPGSDLVTAFRRPLTTMSDSTSTELTRRLFTNPFLPVDALSGLVRAILWLAVPSPELSIILIDWSSVGTKNGNNIGPISPIASPVFLSLLTGAWGVARRLVFGQLLVTSQSNSDTSTQGVLIGKRNDRAMDVLREAVDTMGKNGEGSKRAAILYGAAHSQDLHRLLRQEGMKAIKTEWRTAFTAIPPRWGNLMIDIKKFQAKSNTPVSSTPAAVDESVAVGLVVVPLYLMVGAIDWVLNVGECSSALEVGAFADAFTDIMLYLLRHVALYVGIAKIVVNWGGSIGVFEESEATE